MSPCHHDESKTLGALVIPVHVPELTKQHDQVVLSLAEGDVGDVKPLGDGLLVPGEIPVTSRLAEGLGEGQRSKSIFPAALPLL